MEIFAKEGREKAEMTHSIMPRACQRRMTRWEQRLVSMFGGAYWVFYPSWFMSFLFSGMWILFQPQRFAS